MADLRLRQPEIALYASLVITVGLSCRKASRMSSRSTTGFWRPSPERERSSPASSSWPSTPGRAPLYGGGGFALYLNRRSELEGWDIELSFRNLADRLATGTPKVLAGFALVAMVLGATLAPLPLLAADSEAAPLLRPGQPGTANHRRRPRRRRIWP